MTRHGSLAYYLAAWVCGCFFMTLGVWLVTDWAHEPNTKGLGTAGGFLVLCFLGLIFGAFTSLLFGFILRRIAIGFRVQHLWIWSLIGAALSYPLLKGLSWVGMLSGRAQGQEGFLRLLLFAGIRGWSGHILLVAIPAGAVTAGVLFAVHRAFAQKAES